MTTNVTITSDIEMIIAKVLTDNGLDIIEGSAKLARELVAATTAIVTTEVQNALHSAQRVSTKRALTDELVVLVRDLHINGMSYNKLHNMLLLKYDIDMSGDAIRSCCERETYKDVK